MKLRTLAASIIVAAATVTTVPAMATTADAAVRFAPKTILSAQHFTTTGSGYKIATLDNRASSRADGGAYGKLTMEVDKIVGKRVTRSYYTVLGGAMKQVKVATAPGQQISAKVLAKQGDTRVLRSTSGTVLPTYQGRVGNLDNTSGTLSVTNRSGVAVTFDVQTAPQNGDMTTNLLTVPAHAAASMQVSLDVATPTRVTVRKGSSTIYDHNEFGQPGC